jgi:Do/DeqQ family serine protease
MVSDFMKQDVNVKLINCDLIMKKIFSLLAVFLFGGLVFYAITVFTSSPQPNALNENPESAPVQQTSFLGPAPVNGPDFTEAASRTVDAVVHIRSQFRTKSQGYDDFFGALREYLGYDRRQSRSYPISGWGSGVIVSSDGYVVTNNHVVEGADLIEVILNDKRVFEGKVVGLDPRTDLALLQIESTGLPYISYGNSDQVRVGEWVLAVGNPFNLTSTVTAGIVSAKARNINILGIQGAIESFIQTDAAVNRGNSGGALVNISGELIGINAAIASNTGYYQGYSFAIPVNIVKKVISDMMEFGEVQRAYLGVVIREMDQNFADQLGLDDTHGVYVDGLVEGGGAVDAGIEIGDVILSVDDMEVNSLSQLLEIVAQHNPGDELDVYISREGRMTTYSVELRSEDGTTNIITKKEQFYNKVFGAYLSQLGFDDMEKYRISAGLKVVSVNEGLLSRGGIREGFIIKSVNDYIVDSELSLESALAENDRNVKVSGIYPNGMKVSFEFGL